MPRFKKLLEFDEREQDVLKAAASVKNIAAVTKPYIDHLKDLSKDIQKVAASKQVDSEGLSAALESSEELSREVGKLPDSEIKGEFLEKLAEGQHAIQEALEMAESE